MLHTLRFVLCAGVLLSGCATTGAGERSADEVVSTGDRPGAALVAASASVSCEDVGLAVAARCPQCPQVPLAASVDRGFSAAERRVARCVSRRNVRALRVRAEFANVGVPQTIELSGARLGEDEARCLREVLCDVRVPTFQRPRAVVRYAYEGISRATNGER
jgi:hypothetical protein